MKCPRCSYISFDHNEACPKCRSDLSKERDMMGLPAYQPKPLSILGLFAAAGEGLPLGGGGGGVNASVEIGAEAEDLLISLDSLSAEGHGPVPFEPKSVPVETQGVSGGGGNFQEEDDRSLIPFEPETLLSEDVPKAEGEGPAEEWAIPVDDLSPSSLEPGLLELETEAVIPEKEADAAMPFQPEAEPVFPEKEIHAELVFEPEAPASEGKQEEGIGFRESDSARQEMEGLYSMDASAGPEASIKMDMNGAGVEGTEKKKDVQLDLPELELEPFDLTLEMDEPGKKTS